MDAFLHFIHWISEQVAKSTDGPLLATNSGLEWDTSFIIADEMIYVL